MFRKECTLGPSYSGKTTKTGRTFTKTCKCEIECFDRETNTHAFDCTTEGSRDCWWNKTEIFNDWECTYYLGSCAITTVKGKAGPRYLETWCCGECVGYNFDAPSCGNSELYYVNRVYWDKCDKGNDCQDNSGPG